MNTVMGLLHGALLLLLLCHLSITTSVMLAPPGQVRFDSVDYMNILRWTPSASNMSLRYYIQWKIYGEPQWLDVSGCQGIKKHQCNLTGLTSDPTEWYYARVHADSLSSTKSAWTLSRRFNPRWDTKISSPVLRLNVTEHGIVVRVKSPRLLVRKMHNSLLYKIYLIHTSGEEEVFEMDCCSKKLTLQELSHKTKYCLQAQTTISFPPKSSTRSTQECVTTL
ncbi:interleukin-22 receptor subunit alpha-2 [Solea solea]|uniref:interleukin-22 receptor subunit alpha-2 n=1 Tax=Solea solea TaxID=90069 RepID=UPI00272AE2AC|nr:interleukin-22 receptor subunit alpha-2 [Solea solea]